MAQISLIQKPAELETLYGLGELSDNQKKVAVGAIAGIAVGITLFIVIKNARKKARR